MKCVKCGARMTLKKRITYVEGPAKLVFECVSNRNHVQLVDEPPKDPPREP